MRRQLVVMSVGVAAVLVTGCTDARVPAGGQDRTAPSTPAAPSTPSSPAATSAKHAKQRTGPTVTATVASWTLPHPLAREVVVKTAGGLVVAGGLVAGDASTSRTYRVDVTTGQVTPLPSLPSAVHDAAGADLAGQVLVVGGGNSTEQSTVQRLGPQSKWRVIGRLPEARSDLVAVTADGRLIVAGGYDGTSSPAGVLASSDGRSFQRIAQLAVAVRYPAVAVADGAVWLFGGERDGKLVDVVQRIDPRTGRTRVVGRLPQPLGHGAAAVTHGRILLAGGRTGADTVTSSMWWFDPSTSTFRPAGQLPYPLADSGVVTVGGVTYLLGGETPSLTRRVIRLVVG